MAFRERFKDKMSLVAKDGSAAATAAPPPQQAAVPPIAAQDKKAGGAKAPMPMPMPMPMPLGTAPISASAANGAPPSAAPQAMFAIPQPAALAGVGPVNAQPKQGTVAKHGSAAAARAVPGARSASPTATPTATAAAKGMPMPMPMPMPIPIPAAVVQPPQQQQQLVPPTATQPPAPVHHTAAPVKNSNAVAGRRAAAPAAAPQQSQAPAPNPFAPLPLPPQQSAYAPLPGAGVPLQQHAVVGGGGGGFYAMPPGPGAMPGASGAGMMGLPGPRAQSPSEADDNDQQHHGPSRRSKLDVPPAPLKSGEAPQYTPYTVEDFRRINKPVRLGGLGPNDTDEVRVARQLRERALDYANNNNKVNLVVLAAADESIVKKPLGKQPNKEMQEVIERRARAKEFAKHVPKPRSHSTSANDTATTGTPPPKEDGYGRQDEIPTATNEKLMELEARHKRDQEMIVAMKRQLGLGTA